MHGTWMLHVTFLNWPSVTSSQYLVTSYNFVPSYAFIHIQAFAEGLISVADMGCLSRIRLFSIPDPNCIHPRSELYPSRIQVVHPGSISRIRMLTFYPSRIPDPGVKKAPDPDPQHWDWSVQGHTIETNIREPKVLRLLSEVCDFQTKTWERNP